MLSQSRSTLRKVVPSAWASRAGTPSSRMLIATQNECWNIIHRTRAYSSTTPAAASTMELIKNLRASSGAPIVDCKKALKETDNDVDAALDWLRAHGAAKVSSKVGDREAREGLVGLSVSPDSQTAAMVYVASETDFAGRSETFVDLVTHCAEAAHASAAKKGDATVEDILKAEHNSKTVEAAISEAMIAIRENLSLASATTFQAVDGGVVVGYVHGRILPSQAGSAAAVVDLAPLDANTSVKKDKMIETGKMLAMHIVAAKPQFMVPADVPQELVDAETEILMQQTSGTNKPPEIVEKIVQGRLRKYYESICLTEQAHMIEEDNPKIGKYLKGLGLRLNRFSLVSVG